MEKEVIVLLERIKEGDGAAFAELSELYKTMTDAAAYKFSRSPVLSGYDGSCGLDDLKQYAAVALYRAAVSYEPYTDGKGKAVSFGLYAKICVNNALISVIRKQKSLRRRADRAERASGIAGRIRQSDPLDRLVSSEGAQTLIARIRDELSPYERRIFEGYVGGRPVREIAAELGVGEKSVSNALYRIKVKVKNLLKNQ